MTRCTGTKLPTKYAAAISYILLLVVVMLPGLGCAGYKGAITLRKSNLNAALQPIQEYTDETLKHVMPLANHSFEAIGHRAGSYNEFPKKADNFKGEFPWADVTVLMDRSFTQMGLSGVEVDVGTHTKGLGDVVYIVHDKPESKTFSRETFDYFQKNTLENLLKHFIDAEYHEKDEGKRIYLELKTTSTRSLTEEDSVLVARTMATIDRVVSSYPDADLIKQHLHFASFSFFALEMAYNLAPQTGHEYYLIATTNTFLLTFVSNYLGWISPAKLKITFKKLHSRIQAAPWLTGLWFDPKYFVNYTSLFNGINQARATNQLNSLRFAVAVYGSSKTDYVRMLTDTGQAGKLTHVSGLIFDFDIR